MKKLIYSQEDLDLILSIEAEEKDKEIERLNKDLKDACEVIERLKEDKKKAIKEVREYITCAIENDDIEELKSARHLMLWNEDLDKLLEILDKVGDKE